MCSEAAERFKLIGFERVLQGLNQKRGRAPVRPRVAQATPRPLRMYRLTCRPRSWRSSSQYARYDEQTVVIKFGGHAMGDQALSDAFAKDIVYLKQSGVNPIVVHGGGPQIAAM